MEPEQQKSEFNDAINWLRRINFSLSISDLASQERDASGWFHGLNILFRELVTEMDEDNIKKFKELQLTINSMIYNDLKKNRMVSTNNIPPDIYTSLQDYEIDLRQVYKKSGLQTRLSEDAAKALK
jgi:hypothetical protein